MLRRDRARAPGHVWEARAANEGDGVGTQERTGSGQPSRFIDVCIPGDA